MLFTDVGELRAILEIDPDNRVEDLRLNFCIEWASNWIEEVLNRPGMIRKVRTEYMNGTGTQKLLSRSRPVFVTPTAPQIFVDEGGFFGSVSGSFDATNSVLTYGSDFSVWIDQEDGSSRSGIFIRNNDLWPRPSVRQRGLLAPFVGTGFGTIKVVYDAGFYVDNLPPVFRMAATFLVARLRDVLPLGYELSSESYAGRSISKVMHEKEKILGPVRQMLASHANRKW